MSALSNGPTIGSAISAASNSPDKTAVTSSTTVSEAVAEVEAELGETGRVLLRPSGTEQLVRVMVEAPSEEVAQAAAQRLVGVVSTAV